MSATILQSLFNHDDVHIDSTMFMSIKGIHYEVGNICFDFSFLFLIFLMSFTPLWIKTDIEWLLIWYIFRQLTFIPDKSFYKHQCRYDLSRTMTSRKLTHPNTTCIYESFEYHVRCSLTKPVSVAHDNKMP